MEKRQAIFACIGPESTGKTTLSEQLAVALNGSLVPEFSRTFLEERGGMYEQKDLQTIAKGQLALEESIISKGIMPIICDTDVLVIMVWHEFKYGERSDVLEELFRQQKPRKYLLAYPDLPWQYDALRENPNDLHAIFEHFVKTLKRLGAEYTIVDGIGSSRLQNALNAIKRMKFG